MYHLRFRQIHLDFHTSPCIENIGGAFDKAQWQDALRRGHVDSITTFAKCHHGWSYHETSVGRMHPHLSFDLLRAQFDACKEMDVNVPIYISAGVDNVMSQARPEWREFGADGAYRGWSGNAFRAGFHKMCFNSPYLDYLCEQIREVVRLFPQGDGVFLDIINQGQCCCPACMALMEREGLDPMVEADRRRCAEMGLERYYRETTAATRCDDPDYPVFHNSGHITRGNRGILEYFSHLELESLPTGGWGYDHFPVSAKYCKNLGLDLLGMTGKFHTTWGEFGGYKHPNALRYECAAMLAYGSKCSVGDQLHPEGAMDVSTYDIIGQAYAEVEAKEPWCDNVEAAADIGLLSCESVGQGAHRNNAADTGAARILLEGHFLFDVIDTEMDFSRYKALVLPDAVEVAGDLKQKIDAYLATGGKLLLSGTSGLGADGQFVFDVGAEAQGASPFRPDFILPVAELRPDFIGVPFVMYQTSQRLRATTGEPLGDVYDPYFNRAYNHFCSHQHAPPRPEPSGYHCGVRNGNVMVLAHPVFGLYAGIGSVAVQQYAVNALSMLLGEAKALSVNLPSTGRVSLMHQPGEERYVLHLLSVNTINRGGSMALSDEPNGRQSRPVEVVQDLQPVRDAQVRVRVPETVTKVTLEPQGREVPYEYREGTVELNVDEFTCHQMVVLQYGG